MPTVWRCENGHYLTVEVPAETWAEMPLRNCPQCGSARIELALAPEDPYLTAPLPRPVGTADTGRGQETLPAAPLPLSAPGSGTLTPVSAVGVGSLSLGSTG